MFPAGAAGVALLLVRLGISAMLVVCLLAPGNGMFHWMSIGCAVLASCLCMGGFTPYACTLSCLMEFACFPWHVRSDMAHQAFLILTTASLALLGPGAYSVDARIFGRRVIKR